MPTQTIQVMPVANRSGDGTTANSRYSTDPVQWPANVVNVVIRVTSTQHTDPAETLHLVIEESNDYNAQTNTGTWRLVGNGDPIPGGRTDRRGNPLLPFASIGRDFPFVPRWLRGTLVVNGTVRCGVAADVTTE